MQCEKCQAELSPNSQYCSKCGTLVLQNVEGFEHTKDIERILRTIIENHGSAIKDNKVFIALLNDYLPDYSKERNLLKSMLEAGVLDAMLAESSGSMAIMKAKSQMLQKIFLAENAAEFVTVCFAYLLKIPYDSPMRMKDAEDIEREKAEEAEKQKFMPTYIEGRVLTSLEAMKYRLFPNVNVAEGFTKIDSFSFNKFNFLKTVHLPSTLLAIGEYAFSECKHLRAITLPESLRIIKSGAFSECIKLTLVNIPHGVLEIADNTFFCCQELEVVEIPDTVGSIGASAFAGCEKLRRLILPDSIKFIDKDAFSYCPELTIRCYENTYVHRYCINNGISVETVPAGADLRAQQI